MSGGSFNYLSIKDSDELVEYVDELKRMKKALNDIGAHDAAGDVTIILTHCELIKRSEASMGNVMKRVSDVLQAVEWNQSGDWGKEKIDEALALYRTR